MLEKITIQYCGEEVIALKVCDSDAEEYVCTELPDGTQQYSSVNLAEIRYPNSENNFIIDELLHSEEIKSIPHLVIGGWDEPYEEGGSEEIVASLIKHKDKFNHLESLFIGDMESEACEISWIKQCDYAPLLENYPNLKSLTIKGSDGLSFEKIDHAHLTHFEIISGGLPVSVIEKIATANLPNLESLRLYFGVQEYGFDGNIDTIKSLLRADLFPKLTHLGLLNSEIQNEIVSALMESDILSQLKTLDLSMGLLFDKGGETLLANAEKLAHLEKIKIEYHFMTEEMVARLQATALSFDISDAQEREFDEYEEGVYEYSSPMYTE